MNLGCVDAVADLRMWHQASGGIIGYARTKSLPSIIAGCTVGLLYALGGYRTQNHEPYGLELSFLASVILGGSSIPRAIRLRKPVPMGLSLLATIGALMFGNGLYQRSN
ncbi:hypothetical protein diail_3633 [Diaporthe ilicicola]|nr:hypothetical protein diail_3633 [Diaporthe ilicicola]